MAADASAYGISAVISHVLPDGNKKPIAFASPTHKANQTKKKFISIYKVEIHTSYRP